MMTDFKDCFKLKFIDQKCSNMEEVNNKRRRKKKKKSLKKKRKQKVKMKQMLKCLKFKKRKF